MSRMETRGQLSPNEQSAARCGRIAERNKARQHGSQEEPVDAVKQTAMTRDELARILGAKLAFHPTFQ